MPPDDAQPVRPMRPSPLLGAAAAVPLILTLAYLALWRLGAPLPRPDLGATLLAAGSSAAVAVLVWAGLRASLARVEGNDRAVAAALRDVAEAERLLRAAPPALPSDAAPATRRRSHGTLRGFLLGAAAATLLLGSAWAFAAAPRDEVLIHHHAAWALFVDGERVDYTGVAYDLSSTGFLRGHLHSPDQDILHIEGTPGLTLADFVRGSLGGELTDKSIRLDPGHGGGEHRNEGNRTLRLFVAHDGGGVWSEQASIASYRPRDRDRLLLTFGTLDEATLREQLAVVSARFPSA